MGFSCGPLLWNYLNYSLTGTSEARRNCPSAFGCCEGSGDLSRSRWSVCLRQGQPALVPRHFPSRSLAAMVFNLCSLTQSPAAQVGHCAKETRAAPEIGGRDQAVASANNPARPGKKVGVGGMGRKEGKWKWEPRLLPRLCVSNCSILSADKVGAFHVRSQDTTRKRRRDRPMGPTNYCA